MKIEISPKQVEFLINATHRWNGKIGATQCGKTYIDVTQVIPERLLERAGKNGLNLILGVTREMIERNVLEPMRDFWGDKFVGEINSRNIAVLFGQKVYCLGAEKISHATKLRGAKFKYAYCDEIVDFHEAVFDLLKSRLSLEYSVCDFTGNPSYPEHYIKTFIDSDADVYCQNWTIYDNPFLSPAVVRELEKEYSGSPLYWNRYILGQWTRAEGMIYRVFIDNEKDFYIPYDPAQKGGVNVKGEWQPFRLISIGVDWGGNSSAHAFVATAITQDSKYAVILDGERINAKGTVPDDIIMRFKAFISRVKARYGDVDYVYADSAEQILINLLRQRIDEPVYNSLKKPIIDRIRAVTQLMGQRRLLIIDGEAKNVVNFFKTALYDAKSKEDRRLDDGSYDQDSGDAFEYSIEREINYLIQ